MGGILGQREVTRCSQNRSRNRKGRLSSGSDEDALRRRFSSAELTTPLPLPRLRIYTG
jgi:hypothetical protein